MASYPNHYPYVAGARYGASETASAAARAVREEARTRRAQAFDFVCSQRAHGATCDEVANACGWEQWYSSRPRLSELRYQNTIIDSGWRRRGRSGRLQIVWILPQYASSSRHNPQGNLLDLLGAAQGWPDRAHLDIAR